MRLGNILSCPICHEDFEDHQILSTYITYDEDDLDHALQAEIYAYVLNFA